MYAPALGLPFLGDDYVFLDEIRTMPLARVFSPNNTHFGWYRPWSRELYFWTLQHAVGPNPFLFRAANLLLWLATLLLLGRVIRRIADEWIAVVAVAGTAVLGLWGAPLLWISGAQDLWLVFFLAVTLLLDRSGRRGVALLPYVAALLSKETAAIIPLVLIGLWRFSDRVDARALLRRTLPFAVVTVGWALAHPILLRRLQHPHLPTLSAEPSLPAWQVAFKTTQAMLNVDQLGGRLVASPPMLVELALGGLLLAAAVVVAGRWHSGMLEREKAARVLGAGIAWTAAGWLPLYLPSVGWHAYYGCVGSIGASITIATWLRQDRVSAIGWVLVLGTLRLVNASSESRDWGSEWYQRRAGDLLEQIHRQLLVLRPTLPPRSRVYFGGLPNNIGLVGGDTPALRVWYRDSTLRAGFYSQYRPQRVAAGQGPDLFFHYDPRYGLQEVRLGPEDVVKEAARDPAWEIDHESLALVLFQAGDARRAAAEYEKLGQLPARGDALIAAAFCRERAGDSLAAQALVRRAAGQLHEPLGAALDSLERLRRRVAAAR
jgi:hypothetical protein